MIKKPSKDYPNHIVWTKDFERYERRRLFWKQSKLTKELRDRNAELEVIKVIEKLEKYDDLLLLIREIIKVEHLNDCLMKERNEYYQSI